jgi:hypothetical protein
MSCFENYAAGLGDRVENETNAWEKQGERVFGNGEYTRSAGLPNVFLLSFSL